MADVSNWYQETLGRDGEQAGVDYWNNQIALGGSPEAVYAQFQQAAKGNGELVQNTSYNDANTYSGPVSSNRSTPVDDWARNSLGRDLTPAEMGTWQSKYDAELTAGGAEGVYKQFQSALGGSPMSLYQASQINAPRQSSSNVPSAPVLDQSYTRNPYLDQMADDIGRRSDKSLGFGLQSIRSNAIGVGGLGGSRQGVAEGQAISGANDNLQGNLSNLFGTDYTNSQNRNLQRYGTDMNAFMGARGQDQSYAMGNRQLDQSYALGNQGQMQNFYTNNRQLDQSGMQLGANLYNQGNAGYLGQGQGVYGIGTTQQQAPFQSLNNMSNILSPYAGTGQTATTSGSSGGGASGAIGGALAGAQIGKNLGFGSGGYGSDPYSVGQGTSYNGNYSRM